jgi:hypothetical protein
VEGKRKKIRKKSTKNRFVGWNFLLKYPAVVGWGKKGAPREGGGHALY